MGIINQISIAEKSALERLEKNLHGVSFSQRLEEIVERYEIIINSTPIPQLTGEELYILGKTICDNPINYKKIKHLDSIILTCSVGNKKLRESLSKKN